MKQIATALVKAQKAFGPALKSSTNPHFKSRYADLAACVEAVITGLNDNGIALIQKCYDCENGVMVETMFDIEKYTKPTDWAQVALWIVSVAAIVVVLLDLFIWRP